MKKILLALATTFSITVYSQVFTSSNLPIVILTTNNNQAIPSEPKINGTMKIIYNGPGVRNYVTDPANNYNGNIGIEKRGAYSSSLPQKPYSIELRDAQLLQKDTVILGMDPEHDWLLIANYNDKAFMRNTLPYKLSRKMDHWDAHSKFCEVTLNGNYQGIYLLMESLKRDSNRVSIADLDTNENAGIDVTGGYIIKNDYWNAGNSWLSNFHPIDHLNYNVHLVYHQPNPLNITAQQKTYIQTFINDFETALYSPNFADSLTGYQKYMDVNSFVDYLIINELARNNDGFKKSSYFHKDKDKLTHISKLKAGPVWDFDWAWKDIPAGGCIFDATDGSGWAHHINDCGPDVNSPGWFVRLLQDTNFQNVFRCHWEKYRTTILDTNYLFSYIDSNVVYLNEAQQRHYAKWGHMGQATGTPEVQPPASSFAQEIYNWKAWIWRRIVWLDANIPGHAVNCDFTAIAEQTNTNSNINVFPNPANNILTIQSTTLLKNNRIEIADITGKVMINYNFTNTSNSDKIDISGLSEGIYIYIIYNNNNIVSKPGKLVVIH